MRSDKNLHILIEKELESMTDYYETLLAEYDARFDLMPQSEQLHELTTENTKLRDELKKLNDYITQMVFSKTKKTLRRVTSSLPANSTTPGLVESLEKMLASSELECKQLQNRIAQVSDPNYIEEIQEKILAYEQKIKKAGKSRKTLEIEQKLRGKALNKASEGQAEFEDFAETNELRRTIDVINKKMSEIDQEAERNAKNLQEKSSKLSEIKALHKKLLEGEESLGGEKV